jgi:hypothetical protein
MVVYGGMGKRGGRVPGVQVVHIRAAGRGLRQREAAASIWIMTAAARLRGCAKCKGAGERCWGRALAGVPHNLHGAHVPRPRLRPGWCACSAPALSPCIGTWAMPPWPPARSLRCRRLCLGRRVLHKYGVGGYYEQTISQSGCLAWIRCVCLHMDSSTQLVQHFAESQGPSTWARNSHGVCVVEGAGHGRWYAGGTCRLAVAVTSYSPRTTT